MTARRAMYDQIVSQPALLRDVFDRTDEHVRQALAQCDVRNWQAIYTAGCGDSFYAGLACEMAFARLCRLPMKAVPAMLFARYEAATLPDHSVVFGISNSGAVARSIEAVALAKAAGAETIAVTGRSDSLIAQEAAAAIAVPIPSMGRSPGVRSYTVQLLSLLLSAIRVGELRQVLSPAGAGTWRQRLRDVAECLEETIQAQDALAQQMATVLCEEDNWVFVGSGPSYATALFSAAKLVESCGASAWAQDVEEWAHIQYFNSQERTPTCLLMPSGASAERSLELLPYVKGVGRHTSVVARDTQPISLTQVDTLFPVPQAVPEIFSPLVYCVAGEFLAYYLAEAKNTTFFQATGDGVPDPGQRLRGSQVLRHLPTVHASHEDSDA